MTTQLGSRVAETPTGTTVGAALPLTHYAMRAAGGGLGAGIIIALPATGSCGLAETARVAT